MRFRDLSRIGGVVLVGGLVASCSHSSPSAPAPAALAETRGLAATVDAEFPLIGGSFTIGRGGDAIHGHHSGVARFSSLRETSHLTLVVSGGSGAFAGASGAVVVTGTGLAGEGPFVLEGGGTLTLPGGKEAVVALNLRGQSTASCSASQRITISQDGEGTMRRLGRVAARLSHEVENTGCTSGGGRWRPDH